VNQKTYFVANWKMNCTPHAACELAQIYCDESNALHAERSEIIICPSFDALAICVHIVAQSSIKVGAQTVSPFPLGAHTGQIAAESLAEIGCTYAIIGHSERRQECHETNEQITKQAKELISHGVTPIICIGETEDQFKTGNGISVLEAQLAPLLSVLKKASMPNLIIAYEPVFAIGTGIIPDPGYLKKMFGWLSEYLKTNLPNQQYTLLYGGSVSDTTIESLKGVGEIQGFLIGNASLDFQKFQKIVSLWYTK
jgi:triosephosphate isomerase